MLIQLSNRMRNEMEIRNTHIDASQSAIEVREINDNQLLRNIPTNNGKNMIMAEANRVKNLFLANHVRYGATWAAFNHSHNHRFMPDPNQSASNGMNSVWRWRSRQINGRVNIVSVCVVCVCMAVDLSCELWLNARTWTRIEVFSFEFFLFLFFLFDRSVYFTFDIFCFRIACKFLHNCFSLIPSWKRMNNKMRA